MRLLNDPFAPASVLRALPRAVDDLPLWGQMMVTWRCNLDCAYCSEYDNSRDNVPTDVLLARIDHARELGTLHVDMIGGEPLLHEELPRLMSHVTRAGMTTGMTTNGFLLTEDKLARLLDAGMGRIQISVDAVRPKAGIPKSLRTLRSKIEMVARHPVRFRVNTVLCDSTLDEVTEVAGVCFALGVEVNFSVAHERGVIDPVENTSRLRHALDWLREQKRDGWPISTPYYLMEYYERALAGRPMDWTCQAGTKSYYVSPEGRFQWCFHTAPRQPFLEVTRDTLAFNRGPKGCERACGVDCAIHMSLPYSNMAEVANIEAREHLISIRRRARGLLGAQRVAPARE